jgi:hypothetical protein
MARRRWGEIELTGDGKSGEGAREMDDGGFPVLCDGEEVADEEQCFTVRSNA